MLNKLQIDEKIHVSCSPVNVKKKQVIVPKGASGHSQKGTCSADDDGVIAQYASFYGTELCMLC